MNMKTTARLCLVLGYALWGAGSANAVGNPVENSVSISQKFVDGLLVRGEASGFSAKGLTLGANEVLGKVKITASGAAVTGTGMRWTGSSHTGNNMWPDKGFMVHSVDPAKRIRVITYFDNDFKTGVEGSWYKRKGTEHEVSMEIHVDGAQTVTPGVYSGTMDVGAWG